MQKKLTNKTIVISGTGQNTGKTSLICKIISQNKTKPILAVKISPHFHKLTENEKILLNHENKITIVKETNRLRKKDSSLMLKAGASEVLYVQAKDEYLSILVDYIEKNISPDYFIVFESAGILKYLIPDKHILLYNTGTYVNTPTTAQTIKIKSFSSYYSNLKITL
jgi:hypothetical protein